jgi:hypothetical protein
MTYWNRIDVALGLRSFERFSSLVVGFANLVVGLADLFVDTADFFVNAANFLVHASDFVRGHLKLVVHVSRCANARCVPVPKSLIQVILRGLDRADICPVLGRPLTCLALRNRLSYFNCHMAARTRRLLEGTSTVRMLCAISLFGLCSQLCGCMTTMAVREAQGWPAKSETGERIPTQKPKPAYYCAVPFGVAGDLATFPLQGIAWSIWRDPAKSTGGMDIWSDSTLWGSLLQDFGTR